MVQQLTQMMREILQIPESVDTLLAKGGLDIAKAAQAAREKNPPFLLSVARGSSDHACTFLKYAGELILNLPMASIGPSIKSVYDKNLLCDSALCLAISQSGQSPDIVALTKALTDAGALSIAITNDSQSRLAKATSATIPIQAGPEISVAATKTFVCCIVAGLWLLAEIKRDEALIGALFELPDYLAKAIECDWSPVLSALSKNTAYTLGRGPSMAIANEAALKFKETSLIHAHSYSSAEVMHGPVSVVEQDFPIIAFAAADKAEQSTAETADILAQKGAQSFATSNLVSSAQTLPHVRTQHWLTDPIANIVSFYALADKAAAARGIDPDKPRHLNKVTETV